MNEENNQLEERKSPLSYCLLLSLILIILSAFIASVIFIFDIFKTNEIISITYSSGKTLSFNKGYFLSLLISGPVDIILITLLMLLFKPSGLKPTIGKKGKFLISYIILSLFGLLAYLLIALLGASIIKNHQFFIVILSGFITNIYQVLIYESYFDKRTLSNKLFWEIFRFAIVGLVAAVFDFITCYIVQFLVFKDNPVFYVTIISTAAGFIVGVIINYLMSTYMVYKASKSGFGKSIKGKLLFFILAVIGLFLGMGIQYLTYNIFNLKLGVKFFSYPVDFVLRTLIVMVYNYVSRKLLIYRK